MISYLIKSGLCLGLLLAFYHLFLEKEKMHYFNRFFLLGSVLFSFIAPLFIIYVEPTEITQVAYKTQTIVSENEQESFITLENILLGSYLTISLFLLIRFVKNIIDISLKIYRNQKLKLNKATLILVEDKILPHTFWKYIFINKTEFQKNEIEEELFTHELTHVTQKHTIDIVLLEIIQITFWFNPFIIWLKKAVQLNHEFLADDTVISSHHNISYYQTLLLSKAAWNNKFYLASNLNYSLTKKRLIMMKTPSSKLSILLKKLAILPLLMTFIFVFANRVEAQSEKNTNKPIVVKGVLVKASKKEMRAYNKFMKGINENSILKLKDVKRMRNIYGQMSEAQKKSVKSIYEILPPPPPPRFVKETKTKKVVKGKKAVKGKKVVKGKMNTLIEIIETPKKEKKKQNEWNLLGKRIGDPEILEEEREIIEVIEVIEVPREIEEKEIEILEEKEVPLKKGLNLSTLTIDKLHKLSNDEIIKTSNKKLEGKIIYYINGKKVSKRRFQKLDNNEILKLDVVKDTKGGGKIYAYTK